MKFKNLASGSLMVALAMAPVTQAATLSFDDILLSGGTLSFPGGTGGSLSGLNLVLDKVSGIGTPSNSGIHDCTGCSLTFNTGTLLSSSSGGGVTSYVFAAGGSISVTGDVNDAGASGTLASGVFTSPVFVTVAAPAITVQFGQGTDQKNDQLEAYFGYPANQQWNFDQTSIAGLAVSGGGSADAAFSATVTNVHFDNTPVPIPAAVWLFGSALAGMGIIGRRKAATA